MTSVHNLETAIICINAMIHALTLNRLVDANAAIKPMVKQI